ncbi:MAG: hypothetical protein IKX24_03090 [Prevotella sp.]|nr:hypothetical protein [Prevotella sp.]MBR5061106.1 hypothetical protein [Prevotella sp.]
MTAIQLNAALHRELSYIVTDTTMMEKAVKSLRKIRREHKVKLATSVDSKEQAMQSVREGIEGLKLMKEGKIEARPLECLLNELHD